MGVKWLVAFCRRLGRERKAAPVLVVALLLLAGPRLSFAWGCRGHQIVAYIAWQHLRPGVAERVEQILATPVAPAMPGRCRAPGAPAMVRVAAWADAVGDPAQKRLHYVDLEIAGRQPPDFRQACRLGCVTTAIAAYRGQLQRSATPARRAEALRYLIHLVGDISRPLHDSDDDDHGGNCVRTRLPGRRRSTSLHGDWDSVWPARVEGSQPVEAFARSLDRRWGERLAVDTLDPEAWARQGYRVAVQSIFKPLRIQPGCGHRTIELPADYLPSVTPVLEQQLVRGGLRLAALLNAIVSQ